MQIENLLISQPVKGRGSQLHLGSSRLSLMPLKSDFGDADAGAGRLGSNTGTFWVLVRSEKSSREDRLLAESALRNASSLVICPDLNSLYRACSKVCAP